MIAMPMLWEQDVTGSRDPQVIARVVDLWTGRQRPEDLDAVAPVRHVRLQAARRAGDGVVAVEGIAQRLQGVHVVQEGPVMLGSTNGGASSG